MTTGTSATTRETRSSLNLPIRSTGSLQRAVRACMRNRLGRGRERGQRHAPICVHQASYMRTLRRGGNGLKRSALSEAAVPERAAALRRSAQHEPDTRGICAARHWRDTAEDIACDRLQQNERSNDRSLQHSLRSCARRRTTARRCEFGMVPRDSGWGVVRAAHRMEWGRKGRGRAAGAGVSGTARKTAQPSYASNVSCTSSPSPQRIKNPSTTSAGLAVPQSA